jgi:hypothetical protein
MFKVWWDKLLGRTVGPSDEEMFAQENRDYIHRKVTEAKVRHFLAIEWWPANKLKEDRFVDVPAAVDKLIKHDKEKKHG